MSANAIHRKSGRVSKIPHQLSPSELRNSAKRKRIDADDVATDHDVGSEDVEPEVSDDLEDSEEDRRRPKQSTGRSSAKRTKTVQNHGDLSIRPKASAKNGRKGGVTNGIASFDAEALYASVFTDSGRPGNIASALLQRYDTAVDQTTAQLLNFVLRCAGCSIEIDQHEAADIDNYPDKLSDIQQQYQEEKVTDYPLIAKGKATAGFKRNLAAFFNALVKALETSSTLHDESGLLGRLHDWIAAMTTATFPPLRHTATVIGLEIMGACSEIARDLIERKARTLRQGEGETKKKTVNKARVKDLQGQANKMEAERSQIDETLKDWFGFLFIHRYRDVDQRIRLDCASHLGQWVMNHPDLFFDGTYLRYLGWVMSDASGLARHEVLKQLSRMYKDENKLLGLRQFSDRFRPRMVEIAMKDTDINNRVSAIELLDVLREAGMLEPNDIDQVGKLIFDADLKIRKAVAPFFAANVADIYSSKVDDLGGEETVLEALPEPADDRTESRRLEWLEFKSCAELLQSFDTEDAEHPNIERGTDPTVDVFVAANLESRLTMAARAFMPHMSSLQDWNLLGAFLLHDHSQTRGAASGDLQVQLDEQAKIDSKEELVLLEILHESVKIALNEDEGGLSEQRHKTSKAQRQKIQETRESAAQSLAALIPKLLSKYSASPKAASAVLRLESLLNLDLYQELRKDGSVYAALVDDIRKQFRSHQDRKVLNEASLALLHAQGFDEISDGTQGKMQALWDDTVTSFAGLCNGELKLAIRGTMDISYVNAMSSSALRISKLASISDCTTCLDTAKIIRSKAPRQKQHSSPPLVPIVLLTDIIARGKPQKRLGKVLEDAEDGLVVNAIEAVVFYFMWNVKNMSSQESYAEIDRMASSIIEHKEKITANLEDITIERRNAEDVRVAAAEALLDIHTLFRTLKKTLPDDYSGSGVDLLSPMIQSTQLNILRAFVAAEKVYAKKANVKLEQGDEEGMEDEEPNDDDPESDNESTVDTAEGDDATERRQERRRDEVLLAEGRLCNFASKVVLAVLAGAADPYGRLRQRLGRNRIKLGPNFKALLAELDKPTSAKEKVRTRNQGKKAAAGKKSSATAPVESDDESEIIMADANEDEEEPEDEEHLLNGNVAESAADENDEGASLLGD